MSASIHFVPYREPVLSRVSKVVLSCPTELEKTAVVFASSRAIACFRNTLMERVKQEVLAGPYLYTLEDFLTRSIKPPGYAFPADLQRRVLLNRALRECRQQLGPLFRGAEERFLDDYLAFSSIGDRLLRFYDEVSVEHISFKAIKNNAMYTDFEKHVTVLQTIWENYLNILNDNGFEERSAFKAEGKKEIDFFSRFDHIFLVASGIFSRSELMLLRDISNTVRLDIFMSHEGQLLPQHMDMLNTLSPGIDIPPLSSPLPRISVREFPDAVTQVGFIGSAIQKCKKDGIPDNRIAIVLPDEKLVGSITAILGRKPFNIAMGFPMGTSPYFSLLKIIQQLCFLEKTSFGYSHRSVAAFVTHPFIKNIINTFDNGKPLRVEAGKMLDKIQDDYRLRLPLSVFEGIPAPGLISELERAEDAFNIHKPQTLKKIASSALDYLIELEQQLNTDFLKKLYLDRDVRSSREKILEVLAEITLIDSDELINTATPQSSFSLLISILEGQTYNAVNREGVISVIGLLETRNLQFDAVIIPDMNEGIIPGSSRKDLFLNTSIRKSLGLPTQEDREALFGFYLNQVLRGAKQAYLSYVRSDERGLRSRFLEEIILALPSDYNVQAGHETFRECIVPGQFKPAPEPEEIKKDEETITRIKKLNYSTSSIETYLRCPYKFYLSRICQLKDPVRINEELPAWLKGQIFHDAVSTAYKNENPAVLFRDVETHNHIISEAIDKQAERYDQVRYVPSNRFALNNWKKRLKKFSENELIMHHDGWRTIVTELKVEINHKSGLRLKGYIDRIDCRGDEIRIIDYKTGSLPKTRKECRLSEGRGVFTQIQLPFYLLLLSEENKVENLEEVENKIKNKVNPEKVEGLYFYDLKEKFQLENRYDDFVENDRTKYLISFDQFISSVLAEIKDPSNSFQHAEDKKNCVYCPFDLTCRIKEKGISL